MANSQRIFSVSIGTRTVEARKANLAVCMLSATTWARRGYSPVLRTHGGVDEGVVRVRVRGEDKRKGLVSAEFEPHPYAVHRPIPEWARSAIHLIESTQQGE